MRERERERERERGGGEGKTLMSYDQLLTSLSPLSA